jgi:hypothetical protein
MKRRHMGSEEVPLASGIDQGDRKRGHSARELEFVLCEGQAEIPCRISFDALRRRAGVVELSLDRARRLLRCYRREIERIALVHYIGGALRGGMVIIEERDIGAAARRH